MIYSCSWNKIIARNKGPSQRWEEGECNEADDSSSSEFHASGDVNHSLSSAARARVALEGKGWWWRCSRLISTNFGGCSALSRRGPNLQGRKISAGSEKHSQSSSIGMAIKITIPTKIMLSTLFLDQFCMQNPFLKLPRH